MRHITRILIMAGLWIATVLTMTAWGISQVQGMAFLTNIGQTGVITACAPGGFCTAIQPQHPLPLPSKLAFTGDFRGELWHELDGQYADSTSFLGYRFWCSADGSRYVLWAHYPAVLITLVFALATLKLRSKARRAL